MPNPYTFDHLYENAACGLVLTYANGEIIHANSTFCRYLDYDDFELKGKRIQDLFTVGGRFFHYTHWAPLLQMQGSVAEVQMDLLRSDGCTIPMIINAFRREFEGEFFHELSIFVSTDRKKYERELLRARASAEASFKELQQVQKELEKSHEILSVAMLAAKMGLWSAQKETENFWCSLELLQLLGLPQEACPVTFDNFIGMMHEDDRSTVRERINYAIAELCDYTVEFRLTTSGLPFHMQMRGRATKESEHTHVFGIVIDVTELRESELAVLDLNKELALADRRKDEFLATLAHELRNPLTPILNVSEIIKRRSGDDPHIQWASEVVLRQLDQITHLIDDLMDVSRITQGRLVLRKEGVCVGAIINRAIEDAQPTIQKHGLSLVTDLSDTDTFLSADPIRLLQIISNLLTNAAKYTPAHGTITVMAGLVDDTFMLAVRDTGIGISKENLPKIFKMFSQLQPAIERSQGGLGIGLALSRGLAELHGGTLEANSQGEEKGSEFILRMPVIRTDIEIGIEKSSLLSTPITKRRVLIVDDNVDAAETLAHLLELHGCETCIANDGITTLSKGAEFRPQVTLLDIGLPDLNGYEVARRMRSTEWGRATFLVATTGWGQQKDKQLAAEAGFNDHITKPINLEKLRNVLDTIPVLQA